MKVNDSCGHAWTKHERISRKAWRCTVDGCLCMVQMQRCHSCGSTDAFFDPANGWSCNNCHATDADET